MMVYTKFLVCLQYPVPEDKLQVTSEEKAKMLYDILCQVVHEVRQFYFVI